MSRDTLKTLFHPFDIATLVAPAEGERVLFLGAEPGTRLPDGFAASVDAVQPFRPLFRGLEAARTAVTPRVENTDYDATLILCGKHKGLNEDRIAEALKRTKVGGLIVVAGAKDDGIVSLRKKITNFGWNGDSMPKYHGVVFWFGRPEDAAEGIAKLEATSVAVEGGFTAAPGMFSHDRVDPASELLASRFTEDFRGHAADFGAGWGYLSVMLAKAAPSLKGIDLFEADYDALESAKVNMAAQAARMPARFYWHDLKSETIRDHYDLIVMNPPFHEGQASDPSIGVALIKAAAGAVKSGGRLMLVANRGLPYEQALAESFRESGEICRNARFKVLFGRR